MTDGGRDTTRGQRWSSKLQRRRKRECEAAQIQRRKESQMAREALKRGAEANPGAVVEVGTDVRADLSSEPGHVQSVVTDTVRSGINQFTKRVRVTYISYGLASDMTEDVDGERVPAGELTPEDVSPYAVGTHAEFIAAEPRERLDDTVERVEQYITDRWDPDWKQRERVSGQVSDSDE